MRDERAEKSTHPSGPPRRVVLLLLLTTVLLGQPWLHNAAAAAIERKAECLSRARSTSEATRSQGRARGLSDLRTTTEEATQCDASAALIGTSLVAASSVATSLVAGAAADARSSLAVATTVAFLSCLTASAALTG